MNCRFDGVPIKGERREGDLAVVDLAGNQRLDFWFEDVVDREIQRDSREGTSPGRISLGHCHGVELTAFRSWRSQEDDDVLVAAGVHRPFDFFLTFQVNGARRRSDKAVGLFQQNGRARGAGARSDRRSGNAVALANGDHALPNELKLAHSFFLPAIRSIIDVNRANKDSLTGASDRRPCLGPGVPRPKHRSRRRRSSAQPRIPFEQEREAIRLLSHPAQKETTFG